MRQIVFSRYGAPDVLMAREAPTRAPAAGEVRTLTTRSGVEVLPDPAAVGEVGPPSGEASYEVSPPG